MTFLTLLMSPWGLLLALVAVLRGTRTAEGKLTAAFFAKGSARQAWAPQVHFLLPLPTQE